MYYTKEYLDNLFPYMPEHSYFVMPAGLPNRFYPEKASRKYEIEDYVICFNVDLPEEIKQRFAKDYEDWIKKEFEMGHY